MSSALETFIEISQWKDSRESAQACLDAANGSVERALALLYDGTIDPPSPKPASHASSQSTAANPPVRSLMEELNAEYKRDLVKSSAPRVSPTPVVYKLRFPRIINGLIFILDKIVGIFLRFLPLRPFPTAESLLAARLAFFDENVAPVLAAFGNDTASTLAPRLLSTRSYNDALELVKSELKFLLVIVVSEVHESSVFDYLQQVFLSEAAKRDDTYLWIGSALSVEGLGIASAFKANALPLISLVSASPKTAHSNVIVMERLLQLTGSNHLTTPEYRAVFSKNVANAIEDQESKLLSLKLDRQQFNVDREIRKQQDSAYERSLQADREKAEVAKKEREQAELAELKHKSWLHRVSVRSQMYSEQVSPPGDSARVGLRLPSGRMDLRVPGDAPVSYIFDVVYMQLHKDELGDLSTETTDDDIDLTGYAPYGFTLMSTLSRRQLELSDEKVKENSDLWPSGVLVVDLD